MKLKRTLLLPLFLMAAASAQAADTRATVSMDFVPTTFFVGKGNVQRVTQTDCLLAETDVVRVDEGKSGMKQINLRLHLACPETAKEGVKATPDIGRVGLTIEEGGSESSTTALPWAVMWLPCTTKKT
jgi:hypothetical protein